MVRSSWMIISRLLALLDVSAGILISYVPTSTALSFSACQSPGKNASVSMIVRVAAPLAPFAVMKTAFNKNSLNIFLFDNLGEDLEKLTKCEFGGKSYYEGERIDTGRSCYSCFCGKGFEDKPFQENKHCHKVNCNMEVHYSQQITDGCVPIYWKTDDCCPIEWRCPDKETKVVPDSSRKSTEVASDIGCTFGGLKMNVGDFLSPENDYDQCTICSCKVPPFPHCIKTC